MRHFNHSNSFSFGGFVLPGAGLPGGGLYLPGPLFSLLGFSSVFLLIHYFAFYHLFHGF